MDAGLPSRIDLLQVAINVGGGEKTLRRLLRLYLSNTLDCLNRIEKAIDHNNYLAWQQTVHELKGASQNMTAKRMAALCMEAERIDCLPHEHAISMLYHMEKELALIKAFIGNLADDV